MVQVGVGCSNPIQVAPYSAQLDTWSRGQRLYSCASDSWLLYPTTAAFTLERFWTKTVQINTALTYRLHKNDEIARGKRSLPNPQLKVDTCKNGATISSFKLQKRLCG